MQSPSTPQLKLMLAIVRLGGTDVPGRDLFHIDGGIKNTRDATIHACHTHNWVTSRRLDGAVFWSITERGRTAARVADPDGYAQALPDDQVDDELARVTAVAMAARAEPAWPTDVPTINIFVEEGHSSFGELDALTDTLRQMMTAGRSDEPVTEPNPTWFCQYPTLEALTAAIDASPTGTGRVTMLSGPNAGQQFQAFHVNDDDGALAAAGDPARFSDTELAIVNGHRHQVAAGMTGTDLDDLDDERRIAFEEHGIVPQVFDRLSTVVVADLVDELRPHFVHVAAELARAGLTGLDPVVLDPCGPGYRLAVHVARRGTDLSESARSALFHVEVGLNAGARGYRGMAVRGAANAARALGIAAYGGGAKAV